MSSFLEAATSYCEMGMSVYPLCTKDKRPAIQWEKYQYIKATKQQITDWWAQWPTANVGIVTGWLSGILVIDLDNINALPILKKYIPWHSFGDVIPMVGTGKGIHFYFKYPEMKPNELIGNRRDLLKDVDVRGQGGYVMAPPSVHPNGTIYKWLNKGVLDKGFPEVPPDLMRLLQAPHESKPARSVAVFETFIPSNSDPDTTYRVRMMSSGNWTCQCTWYKLGRIRHPDKLCDHIRQGQVQYHQLHPEGSAP